jgi:uncharacterized protein
MIAHAAAFVAILAPASVTAQNFSIGMTALYAGDYATAMREWRPLAEQGDARAQYRVGSLYSTGRGVARDYIEAARWYRAAARQGQIEAQCALGAWYRIGRGVPQDFITAHMWSNICAAHGRETGEVMRDFAAQQMTSEDIREAQRRARVCMSSAYLDCD